MTEDELKRKEADKDYFHSERDGNKDGYLDTVRKFMLSLFYSLSETSISRSSTLIETVLFSFPPLLFVYFTGTMGSPLKTGSDKIHVGQN